MTMAYGYDKKDEHATDNNFYAKYPDMMTH